MRTWSVFPGDIRDVRKWTSYIKALGSYRITACECMHLVRRGHFLHVTWQRWLSYQWIRHTRKPHATRKPHGAIFYGIGVMGDLSLHCGNRNFRPFDLHIRTWPVLPWDTPDVQVCTSYVKDFDSYRQTYIQTIHAWSLSVTWQRWCLHHLLRCIQEPRGTRKPNDYIL